MLYFCKNIKEMKEYTPPTKEMQYAIKLLSQGFDNITKEEASVLLLMFYKVQDDGFLTEIVLKLESIVN